MGEHQDYLGLEVISGALNLFVEFSAVPVENDFLEIHLIRLGETRRIELEPEQNQPIDYLESGLKWMVREGFRFNRGFMITIAGDLPIGKGVSSSSALCTGWIALLSQIAENRKFIPARQIAQLAFQAEVVEFNQPGGMQDHLASAVGGLLHMDFGSGRNTPRIKSLPIPPPGFLLADSGSTKDTLTTLHSIRNRVCTAARILTRAQAGQEILKTIRIQDIPDDDRRSRDCTSLIATLVNRNLTRSFLELYVKQPDERRILLLGKFMNTHHRVLSKLLNTSSARIDELQRQALGFGAVGAKVVGSGGGGCLLVYAPSNTNEVAAGLSEAGAGVIPVSIGPGIRIS
ncbi:hypothetical protein JXA40_00105 [bacterium]|nr:hypothetical protein [candidate division CSSED10-310 bacterium]